MKLRLLFISLFICSVVSAQDFIMKQKLADHYYNRFDYYKAIPMYEQLLIAHPGQYGIYEKLADSYRRINDAPNAERCYASLLDTTSAKPEYLLHYAQALARNGKYSLSKQWYAKYGEARPDDSQGPAFAKAYENIRSFYIDSASFVVRKAPFNSDKSDFSPAYYQNGIMFASARRKFSIIRLMYNWTYSSYLDLFFAKPDDTEASPIDKGINTIYHEGPVTFNKTQDTILFTRSNFYKLRFRKSNEGINKLKLYQARYNTLQKCWVDIKPLPFNSNEYSVGHPSLSADGHTLYFASDMPGGLGGTDIYVSHLVTDSIGSKTWSKPENLGETINSPGNETFPYTDPDGDLWFASNGIPGLGGLDIFVAHKTPVGFAHPVNPGYPVNTRFDDFGFITRSGGKDGYLSSDRYNEAGNDDIFRIKRISQNLVIKVIDATSKQAVGYSRIYVKTQRDSNSFVTTTEKGTTPYVIAPALKYQFQATREKYIDSTVHYSFDELAMMDTLSIGLLRKVPKFDFKGHVYSEDDKQPFAGAVALLQTTLDTTKERATVNEKGEFMFKLKPGTDYKVSISIIGRRCTANPYEVSTKGMDTDNSFIVSFPVFCVGDIIKVENIYYDLGKYNIRAEAAKELDKLYDLMSKYPKMKIELRSHTDSRGSDAANMKLSDNRAKAAAEYLYKREVAKDRVTGKGYGESQPVNRCVNGVKCSEEEFQVNRRTEFKILSVE